MTAMNEGSGAFAQNKRLGRGVNVIGYDPLWKDRSKARMQAKHFRLIKEAGFQSVRIPLHPWRDLPPGTKGVLTPAWLGALDWAVEQVLANDLVAILDFHEFTAMGADPAGSHERYLETWRALAPHCRNLPSSIFLELLNEPARNFTAEQWNQYLQEAHTIVRETNPDRTLVIGPIYANRIEYLDVMELPEDDRNIIATVHYYFPHSFTHQGAPWATRWASLRNVEWLGTPAEQEAIEWTFSKGQNWSVAHDRPLYLGEFGVFDTAPMASRVRWLSFMARQAEKLGWSWGYWQFDKDFVLYDIDNDRWNRPVLDALIPPQS
jgi:endoglucanase